MGSRGSKQSAPDQQAAPAQAPAPVPVLDNPQRLTDLVAEVAQLTARNPANTQDPLSLWQELAAANEQLRAALAQPAAAPTLPDLLRQVLQALLMVVPSTTEDAAVVGNLRTNLCQLVGAPPDLCVDQTPDLDALMEAVLARLNHTLFQQWSYGRDHAYWRQLYDGAVGGYGKSAVVEALRTLLWGLYVDNQAEPLFAESGIPQAMQVICEHTGRQDELCANFTMPVHQQREPIDLNAMYAAKCTGAKPWRGSVLCNLGEGGAVGRVAASVRLVRNLDGGYAQNGAVVALVSFLESMYKKLQEAEQSRAVQLLASQVSALTTFKATYEALAARVAAREEVTLDQLDELALAAETLMQAPVIRHLLAPVLRAYNVQMLDHAEQSGTFVERPVNWLMQRFGLV